MAPGTGVWGAASNPELGLNVGSGLPCQPDPLTQAEEGGDSGASLRQRGGSESEEAPSCLWV